jgi:hypothetical protein
MNPVIQLRKATALFFVVFGFACFPLWPVVYAQCPSHCDIDGNTAEGDSALGSNTTGTDNTAIGQDALGGNTTGVDNTATGSAALQDNTTGSDNTATGFAALLANTANDNTATGFHALELNTTGSNNTAMGASALVRNTTGSDNTAAGSSALLNNSNGNNNTATGFNALLNNTTGGANTATGLQALDSNTTGGNNTATGENALFFNTTGFNNTAEGFQALLNNTGSSNIAVGSDAGINLTTGSNSIDIGNAGVAGESGTIRIGTQGTQTKAVIAGIHGVPVTGAAVKVSATGQLGTQPSSKRFKDEIRPIDKASEAILALKPVAFRYKKEVDPERTLQFGLVAEDVEKVNPDLVARDADGKPYTVRYDAVNAMLLNEFLKEHRHVQEQDAIIARQQKQIEALNAGLQKVNDKMELTNPAPQTVLNNR